MTPSNDSVQQSKGCKDDVTSAPESGDPKASGRSHGQIIDERGAAAGKDDSAATSPRTPGHNDNTSGQSADTGNAVESGRQRATP